MRLSRVLMLMGALTLSAMPAAAQGGKALGKPTNVGKPAGVGKSGTTAKGPKLTATSGKGKSADHAKSGVNAKNGKTTTTDSDTETTVASTTGRGKMTLEERIGANPTLKARVEAVMGDMTFADATSGWRNQGQLVAAMNALERNPGITFADLHAEMTGPGQPSVGQAVKKLNAEAAATPPVTETTTTTTSTTTTTTTP